MRLIDADALETHEQLEPMGEGRYEYVQIVYKDDIDAAPTIEARKKGRWLDGHRAGYGESLYWYIYCSECLWERDDDDHDKDTPYCPNCGADMREGAKQE